MTTITRNVKENTTMWLGVISLYLRYLLNAIIIP
ncbi:MAG: hypothetical protein Lokiarch_07820, partial [Candidatus Lokiarchaeum sp. GC14_75]